MKSRWDLQYPGGGYGGDYFIGTLGNLRVNTATLAPLISAMPTINPTDDAYVIIGVSWDGGTLQNSTPSQYGQAMAALATYLANVTMSNGHPFPGTNGGVGLETYNEPDDGSSNISYSQWLPYYTAAYNAVKAAVGNKVPMFAPVTDWCGAYQWTGYSTDYYDCHEYPESSPVSVAQAYSDAYSGGGQWVGQNTPAPIALTEYNSSWCNDPNWQNGYGPGIAGGFISGLINTTNGAQNAIATAWDLVDDANCGVSTTSGYTPYPVGYFLSAAGAHVTGTGYTVTHNANGLYALASEPSLGHVSILLVNPNSSTSSGQIALSSWSINSTGNGTLNSIQWRSGSSASGSTGTVSVTGGLTASVSLPAYSATILYN